ncbi:MAG: hypothetical protein ACPGO3_00460 [Magnetospiraceae bacterium]
MQTGLFYTINDGAIVLGPVRLPATWKTPDGKTITGFRHLTLAKLKALGWLPETRITAQPQIGQRRGADQIVIGADEVSVTETLEARPGPEIAAGIKTEANRRITAIYPEWQQRNMLARGLELQNIGPGNWTQSEADEVAAIQAAWGWIKSIRTNSNALEGSPPADFDNDTHWPANPA